MIQREISFYDLMQYPEAKQAILNNDEKAMKKVLYSLGLDINEFFEVVNCYHRPLTKKDNEPWYGSRYVGVERQDKAYLESGNSSWENIVDSTSDIGLKLQLEQMSRQGSSEKAFTSKSAARKAIKEDKSKVN